MTQDETANRSNEVGSEEGLRQPCPDTGRPVHPLGPLWSMVRLDSPIGGRLYAAGVLAGVVAIFAVAAHLNPNGLSQGVHEQLGLPPCGFVVMAGLPCPTCGMTTSFAHTIRGHVGQAVHAQFAGFVLAAFTLAAGVFAAYAIVSGRRPAVNWYKINPMHVVWVCCGLFVAAWGVKILFFLLEGGSAGRVRF